MPRMRPRPRDLYDIDDPFAVNTPNPAQPAAPTSTYTQPGYQAGATGTASSTTSAPAAPTNGLGSFASQLEGFDWGKLTSGHDSPKYQVGRILSQFDPKGGITPAMLQQLNALGIGTFSQKGKDVLSIGGNVDPRFEGVTEFDVIRDVENGGGWQWGGLNAGGGGGGTTFTPGNGPGPFGAPTGGINPNAQWGASGGGAVGGTGGGGGGSMGPNGVGGFGGQQVGGDPFSQMIDSGFANFLNANNQIINQGGMFDPRVTQRRMESVREGGDMLRRSQTNSLRGALADRGLLSEPGYGSGPERTGLERIETQDIAPLYATAFRDIGSDELARADQRFFNAGQSMLGGLQGGTQRQGTISNIALQALGQNMAWNQFLAQYGMDRDQFMLDAQQGRIENYLPIIQLFLQYANQASRGYIG